ncbi:MAG: hypothetical protein MHM6MM_005199 [Cercozoa sp. M6MM]
MGIIGNLWKKVKGTASDVIGGATKHLQTDVSDQMDEFFGSVLARADIFLAELVRTGSFVAGAVVFLVFCLVQQFVASGFSFLGVVGFCTALYVWVAAACAGERAAKTLEKMAATDAVAEAANLKHESHGAASKID